MGSLLFRSQSSHHYEVLCLGFYSLQGFSEDVNQDGFVDPIGQAVAVAPTYTYTVPAHVVPALAPVEVKTVSDEAVAVAPPVVQYTAASVPVVHAVAPTVVKTGLVPASTKEIQVVHAAPVIQYTGAVPVKVEAVPVKYASAPVVQYAPSVITHSSFVPLGSGVPFLSGLVPAVAPGAASVDSPVEEV